LTDRGFLFFPSPRYDPTTTVCGIVVDPDGYPWMVGTHIAEPTPQEMNKAMKEQARTQATAAASGS
jgi:hypothetical protein